MPTTFLAALKPARYKHDSALKPAVGHQTNQLNNTG